VHYKKQKNIEEEKKNTLIQPVTMNSICIEEIEERLFSLIYRLFQTD
jgi:hypothetical protein